MKTSILIIGLLLLFAAEILRVYFIMPFPGSQQSNSLGFSYWLGRNIGWLRIVLIALIAAPLIAVFRQRKLWQKIVLALVLGLYAVIFFFVNFRFEADKMFYQPKHKSFSTANPPGADSILVIGVALDGEAKAFPIQIIGYHHQVIDTIGHTPAMITYCTVCRTGRVFSPLVNGKPEMFRLVGMDHFNAMFEDATTKSWWRQATGEAVAGPLKGQVLAEIPSQQMSLAAWLARYPQSTVMDPDTAFTRRYKGLVGYNKGTIAGSLEKRDSASWKFKSWVVGVVNEPDSRAYDWNQLVKDELIEDTLHRLPIVLALENDSVTFHVWNRNINGQTLHFQKNKLSNTLTDSGTQSTWNMGGLCTDGPLKGNQLQQLRAYQEFWHSWKQFHRGTGTYP